MAFSKSVWKIILESLARTWSVAAFPQPTRPHAPYTLAASPCWQRRALPGLTGTMAFIHCRHKLLGQRERLKKKATRVQMLLLPLSGYVGLRMSLGPFKPQLRCV